MSSERPIPSGRVTATRDGVEFGLARIGLGIRAFDLTQAAISSLTGSLGKSINPGLDLGMLGLISLESLLLGVWLARRRSVIPFAWPYAVDLLLSATALGSAAFFTTADDRISVWTMWPYPVTLSTVVILGGACVRWWSVLILSGTLAGAYLAVVAFPLAGNSSGVATALANSVAYPGFAMVAFLFCNFVRRLATTADDAQTRIVELENERSRAIVHELLPYLKLDDFATADEKVQARIADQRQAKYEQMRSYVDGVGGPSDLEELVRHGVGLHRALSPRIIMDVDGYVELLREVAERLERALDTALANVEQHAMGANVVVSVSSAPRTVTVRVLDNGPGFSASLHRPGFGIAEILGRQLAEIGGSATVNSIPGRGTVVEIVVPREER
jgi:hypothetical protein